MAYAPIHNDLTPFEPPLGPLPASLPLYNPNPVTLILKDKLLSPTRDNFTVQTPDGLAVCTCAGKLFSAHGKHVFAHPATGAELFTVSRAIVSVLPSFTATRPDGSIVFEFKGHFKVVGSRSTVSFANASDGRRLELQVVGKWATREAEITLAGRPVARVRREMFNARAMLGDANTYYVTVAPNVDLTLMTAVCVCMDEVLHRNSGAGNLGLVGSMAG